MQNVSKEKVKVAKNYMLIIIIIIIIIISFFKVDFYITFYNYKKPINVNIPIKLEKNSVCKLNTVINQLTVLFLCQYRPFNGEKYKRKRKYIYYITYNLQNKKCFYSSTTHDYYIKPTCCK